MRAGVYMLQADYVKAIADYTQVIKRRQDWRDYEARAEAYRKSGDAASAAKDEAKAKELKAKDKGGASK